MSFPLQPETRRFPDGTLVDPPERLGDDTVLGYDTWVTQDPSDIIRVLAAVGGSRALELASGTGRISNRLTEYYSQVVAVDASAMMLDVARAKACSGLNPPVHIVADMADLPLRDEFDLVVLASNAICVLPTLELQIRCLKEVDRVCRTGGTVAVENYLPNDRLLASSQLSPIVSVLNRPDGLQETQTTYYDRAKDVLRAEFELRGESTQLSFGAYFRLIELAVLDSIVEEIGWSIRERWSDWSGTAWSESDNTVVTLYECRG